MNFFRFGNCSLSFFAEQETIEVLEKLLRVKTLVVQEAEVVLKALHFYSDPNADFAACLIERSAHHANCTKTVTFDTKAARTAGMSLIQ